MHPRTQELLDYIEGERAALREAVAAIPGERHATAPAPDSWSVLAVLEHLAIVEHRIAGMLRPKVEEARAAGVKQETEMSAILPSLNMKPVLDRSVKRQASEASQPKTVRDLATVWRALDESRAALRKTMLDADGMAWRDIIHPHPALGPINLYEWFGFVGAHEARHAAQIREIGASVSGVS